MFSQINARKGSVVKLCTIVGARPQFIKAATLSRLFQDLSAVEEIIVHTGQHYDDNMSSCFFDELAIQKPAHQLNIGSATHGHQTGKMLIEIETILLQEKPAWVLVYGDTNSTLAGALAAAKLKIPVIHIEAGLRSFNRNMPEEINRVITDHLSELLFTPSENSRKQLLKEGIPADKIYNVGDVMFDATLFYNEFNKTRTTVVDHWNLLNRPYVLATIHRAENTDDSNRLKNICDALIELSNIHRVVMPLHPRTRNILHKKSWFQNLLDAVRIVEPVGYLDMLALEQHASLIVTDSGGVQKEAYFNRIKCVTLRNETEWVELVDAGWNHLCSPDNPIDLIPYLTSAKIKVQDNLYGNGDAAHQIINILTQSCFEKTE